MLINAMNATKRGFTIVSDVSDELISSIFWV